MASEPVAKALIQSAEGPPDYDQPAPAPSRTSSETHTASTEAKSGIVKRITEKTADKFHRSKSAATRNALSQSQPSLPPSSPKRPFSRSKKGKERVAVEGDDETIATQSQQLSPVSRPSGSRRRSGQSNPHPAEDESPFITPLSPPFGPTRSFMSIFRGDGSMRAGTQTLIQALQALPLVDDHDADDDIHHDATPTEPDSDEDDSHVTKMASSIHTIYRPLARSRRGKQSATRSKPGMLSAVSDAEDEPTPEEPVMSEEELEDDFERSVDRHYPDPRQSLHSPRMTLSPLPEVDSLELTSKSHPSRSGSMATVKLQRRARLAEKLREVFDISGIQEVIAEMPCWLLRSILLQGYMYLTDSYLCFFAHMPSREDQVLKSGWLSKRATRTKRWIKHWFILKNDVLSWYQSSSDPYFPHGVADLRYAITCEPSGERDIRIRTNQKTIKLSADSVPSRDEWVKAIRKVMFKAQNSGDSVKIAIPYSAIVDVEKSSAMDFSETIEVKAVDKNDAYSIDSYFFAYFHDLPAALEQIRDAVRAYRTAPGSSSPPPVIDTTVPRSPPPTHQSSQGPASPSQTPQTPKSSLPSPFRFTSLLRPLQDSIPLMRGYSAPGSTAPQSPEVDEYTHVARKSGSSFVPITSPPAPIRPPSLSGPRSPSLTPTPSNLGHDHTYPPSTSGSFVSALSSSPTSKESSAWTMGVPAWLKSGSKRLLSSASFPVSLSGLRPAVEHSASAPPAMGPGVSEIVTSQSNNLSHSVSRSSGDFGYFSVLETPESTMDEETAEKFRTSFAFDEKEKLLGCFQGYVFRLLPVYGRLYISSNYFTFRSSGPLTSRTTMILPIRDILSTQPTKAFRFGHHGLVVIVRGHEELFFEFSDELRRAAFVRLLEKQIEDVRHRIGQGEIAQPTAGEREALILEEFGPRTPVLTDAELINEPEGLEGSLPAVMFASTSSTFLTFKPKKPLHFTFLTIGSRGDVQPYIALAKGLMADGHRTRIATHGEFKEWIESHGIEFGYVGGDPAELMRICVENGTFTVAFLKEGVQKFRGWIDDLLKTSWEACQGTDVLIESPSAMSGIHIAEALRIPYFRAFTMTWSRTRAYPHAFAVPERKMGGNYNYMTYVLFDQVFWRGTAGQINRWRRNTLGLPGTSLDKMEPHKVPFLYNFSPVVVPPPLDWPEWIRITGYWFLDDANVSSQKWLPPPDLLEFIATAHKENKKIVYIGFGSIVVSDPKAMTKCVVDAVVQSGVYAILSKGWSDRLVKNAADTADAPEPLPKQIYPVQSIPHDWLFQRVDAACHHGGAGTTGASLRAGIPTIIKPFFGDQFFWADRVEALGVGSAVRKLSVQSLTDALIAATTDQKQIQRAKEIGEQIRAENGVATAIEAIYRDLEYARSLIKGLPHEDEGAEHSTIRERPTHSRHNSSTGNKSIHSSASSVHGGAISDWSVISDQED